MPKRQMSAGNTPERPVRATGRSRPIDVQLQAIERAGGDGEVQFPRGPALRVSNLGKIYFPDAKITKGALLRYYARVWPVLEPHVRDRPLVLKRFPEGVGGPVFYQQNAGAKVPEGVRVEEVATSGEGPAPRIIGGDLRTLLYTVQLGCIEVHPWFSRTGQIDSTDRCLIDLDPGDDVPFATAVILARAIIGIAEECDLPMAVKTSGASGIHLMIPLPPKTTYATSQQLASLMAQAAVGQHPDIATVERTIRSRPAGSIYVDAMQNARGKSGAAPYSARPRSDATVSAPLERSELTARLRTEAFTVKNLAARVLRTGDLWEKALGRPPTRRTIDRAIAALEQVLTDAPGGAASGSEPHRSRRGGASVRRSRAGSRR